MIDALDTNVYRNTVLYKLASITGYIVKHAEDNKFLVDMNSAEPIATIHGGPYIMVLFAS